MWDSCETGAYGAAKSPVTLMYSDLITIHSDGVWKLYVYARFIAGEDFKW